MNMRFYKIIFCLCLLTNSNFLIAQKNKPVAIIFDSDMGPDYDDVGAITLLHAFADSGYVKILATVASTKYEGVAAVFNVFNTYFGRPDLPIAVPKEKALELRDWQHWTDTLISRYPHKIKSNEEVPDPTEVYRKILSAQPNKSITIVTTGFLTNLYYLMKSGPDKFSKLNGKDLIRQKVKQLVCMAGRFPSGSEFNVNRDAVASQLVFNNWPTPVMLSGFEIGMKIKTGLPLVGNGSIKNSPVKDVFQICIPMAAEDSAGRMSWDETAVLVAIKGYKPWYKIESGKMVVARDGSNSWVNYPTVHTRLVEEQSPKVVEHLINSTMMHQPTRK
jgi:inosine-uridine nucleoside N-ribohydrolase